MSLVTANLATSLDGFTADTFVTDGIEAALTLGAGERLFDDAPGRL